MKTVEFAAILGIDHNEISKLKTDRIVKENGRNDWDMDQVTAYCEYLRGHIRSQASKLRHAARGNKVADPDAPQGEDKELAEFRKQRARIERYKADEMAGDLVSIKAASKYIVSIVARAKLKLLAIPNAVAASSRPYLRDGATPDQLQKIVTEMIHEVLDELAGEKEKARILDGSRDS